MQNPPPGQQSSIGLAPNIAAALSYIWIVGLVLFFIEKENKFIRFHAMQSVLMGALWFVLVIVMMIINVIIGVIFGVAAAAAGDAGGIIGMIVSLISGLIWLVIPLLFLGALIFAAIKAYGGAIFKFPVIGNMAEKFAGSV